MKPSLFSHVHKLGCSIQRETIATTSELYIFLSKFMRADVRRTWHGVAIAECKQAREIVLDGSGNRAVCVYDTAESTNPAHAELFQTQYVIDEADELEIRRKLLDIFSVRFNPDKYRNSELLERLDLDLQDRCNKGT